MIFKYQFQITINQTQTDSVMYFEFKNKMTGNRTFIICRYNCCFIYYSVATLYFLTEYFRTLNDCCIFLLSSFPYPNPVLAVKKRGHTLCLEVSGPSEGEVLSFECDLSEWALVLYLWRSDSLDVFGKLLHVFFEAENKSKIKICTSRKRTNQKASNSKRFKSCPLTSFVSGVRRSFPSSIARLWFPKNKKLQLFSPAKG